MGGVLSSTMPIALFLACVEPNLGILCVRKHMPRLNCTRYKAKFSSTLSEGDKYGSNSGGVRLHSFDTAAINKSKGNTDPGFNTLIDQLDQRGAKYDARIQVDDTPSIQSDGSSSREINNSDLGVIGVHTRWEVEARPQ